MVKTAKKNYFSAFCVDKKKYIHICIIYTRRFWMVFHCDMEIFLRNSSIIEPLKRVHTKKFHNFKKPLRFLPFQKSFLRKRKIQLKHLFSILNSNISIELSENLHKCKVKIQISTKSASKINQISILLNWKYFDKSVCKILHAFIVYFWTFRIRIFRIWIFSLQKCINI